MEDDFPSIVIGEDTLAAIEDAEKKEETHDVPIYQRKTSGTNTFSGENVDPGRLSPNARPPVNFSSYQDIGMVDLDAEELSHQNVSLCGLSEYLETCMDPVNQPIIYKVPGDGEPMYKRIDQKPPKIQIFNLKDCGLPSGILKKYDEMGIKSMFQWQYECISNELVLSGKNLVYSAPTSAGKTLVAEILTIRSVVEQKKKAIIILPFISVVKEKTNYFQELMEGTGIRVEGFMGGYSPAGGFQHTDIAICTIEKANSLIIRLMEAGSLSDLGIVVVDELHLLGDSHRGYLLELLLTKIRYMCFRDKINIQIVGMSATLPNLELLANWLQAELYQTNFRPVPLRELIKLGKTIYDNNMEEVCKVDFRLPVKGDPDGITFLCLETIAQGFSVLIFCPTKNWCEKLAEAIAKDFFFIGTSSVSMAKEEKELVEKFINELNKSPLSEIINKLKRSPAGLDPILAKTVLLGVAFHHAGLTMDERDILESSFRSGALRVLVATSTLSSGVNLPARRVIVRTPIFHGKLVDILTYKQMIGRAGRMGVDTAGESILVCHEKEKCMVERLLKSDLPPIQSCLGSGRSSKLSASMKRAVFEVMASGVASTPEEVERYTNLTLLAAIMKIEKQNFQILDPLKTCLKYLEESEFIRLESTGVDGKLKYVATHLGEACLAASLPPDQALSLFEELQRARKCFVLEDELHIIYQVTPFSVADQWGDSLDWLHLLNMWESLPPSLQHVGELVGIEERFIVRAMRGTLNLRVPKQLEKMGIHRRFYTALALRELANEVPVNDVAQKYGCSRGMLQNLQQSAAIFAGMVTQFCRRLRWTGLESLASQLQDRLQFGIKGELCDLMRLPLLDGQCARALFNAGIESLAMLAADTPPSKVDQALRSFIPFQSGKTKEEEPNGREMKKKWISSMSSVRNLLEKNVAICLIKQARKIIQNELGVADMKWNDSLEVNKYSSESEFLSPTKLNDAPIHSSVSNSVVMESPVLSFENENLNGQSDSVVYADPIVEENPLTNMSHMPVGRFMQEQSQKNDSGANTTSVKSCLPHNDCESTERLKSSICIPLNESRDGVPFPVQMFHVETKNNSLCNNQISPVVYSSSPVTTFVANQSGRSDSSDFNRTKRTSLDIFSSPVADAIPAANISNQSPSLFGDSFTVDTQLETLMNGSSGSNKAQSASSVGDNSQTLLRCTSNHSSTPKMLACNEKSNVSSTDQSTPSHAPKPFQTMNRLNFSKDSPTQHSPPPIKNSVIPETVEISETCPLGEIITPSKWDFVSMVIDEDLFDENALVKDSGPSNLKSSNVGMKLEPRIESCMYEEATKESLSEAQIKNVSRKQKPLDFNNGVNVGITSARDSRCVNVERDLLDSQVECRGYSNENGRKETTKDIKVEHNLAIGGGNFSVKEKRLSLEAGSSSFLEKFFTSAFDFEDEATMRVGSSGEQIEEEGRHIGHGAIVEAGEQIEEFEEEKEDGWGSHMKNISMEAVHHSIICPPSSEEEEDEDTVIVSSQAFSTYKVKNINSMHEICGNVTKTRKDETIIKFERQLEKSVKNENFTNVNNIFSYKSCSVPKEDSQITYVPETFKNEVLKDYAKGDANEAEVESFHVVDVCEDVHVFKDFCNQFEKHSKFSFSVALCRNICDNNGCEKQRCDEFLNVGANTEKPKISQKRKRPDADDEFGPFYFLGIQSLMDGNAVISGISFSWQDKADSVFFMPLNSGAHAITPTEDDKLKFLKKAFESTKLKSRTCIAMHLKEHLRTLFVAHDVDNALKSNYWDPKVADWLLNPDGKEKNLRSLCLTYCPGVWKLIEACGYSSYCRGCWSLGLDASSSLPPNVRSSIEALVALKSMSTLESLMQKKNLLSLFTDSEMPATCCLMQIEAFGIGFSESQGIHMKSVLASKMRELEKKAYSLAGHSFRMSSPKEVGKVLYQELRLPWKDPKVSSTIKGKKNWSTSKDTLERLSSVHQLPQIVIEWRKMSAILSKTVIPLLRCCQGKRIHGTHITHTSTGRISMYEPNLQNIPRDFELSSLASDPEQGCVQSYNNLKEEIQSNKRNSLSIRHCFTPIEGFLYLSADYSQLELRLIAHMSRDQKLCSILNQGCDVFCQIASAWKNIDLASVTPNLRQQAKRICYGMLYGIGSKTLAEQLGVDNSEASNFIETFKNSFPGLKAFLISAVKRCRAEGFVRTLSGRKRELPAINSSNPAQRAHAERQAINTVVQGSAADLVKAAMVQVDEKLRVKFLSMGSRIFKCIGSSNSGPKRRRVNGSIDANNSSHTPSEAFLVLHLHDELLYEVSMDALESVAHTVKSEMEGIWKLQVELPVNLKVGKSWGTLSKYETIT